jgi:hypothetical protein
MLLGCWIEVFLTIWNFGNWLIRKAQGPQRCGSHDDPHRLTTEIAGDYGAAGNSIRQTAG